MELNEAEIQVLASLMRAEKKAEPTDRDSIEAGGARYWIFREDWSDAYRDLLAKGLIAGDDAGYRLTEAGWPLADRYWRERPDMYWYYYQKFYQAARASDAHSRLCERVFGADLCQEGQTDMAALEQMLELLELGQNDRVLDLGCGAGGIAEHISDATGAHVTGLDYSAAAIAEAAAQAAGKRSRLSFVQGDMNALNLPVASFDAVISLDTLYWVADLEATISDIATLLKPGGRMALFMNHHIGEGDAPELLGAEHTDLSRTLGRLGLSFETHDHTRQIGEFWERNHQAAADLREAFEREGNGFIAASLIRESEEDYLPDVRAGRIARYLYLVRC